MISYAFLALCYASYVTFWPFYACLWNSRPAEVQGQSNSHNMLPSGHVSVCLRHRISLEDAIIFIPVFLGLAFLCILTVFHLYLIARNQTTIEFFHSQPAVEHPRSSSKLNIRLWLVWPPLASILEALPSSSTNLKKQC